MILDVARLQSDDAYRMDCRHRFETDHFFAAVAIGYHDFTERAHRAAVNLYHPKNRNLPITKQHLKHKRIHFDPRHTFKTSLKRVDRLQWIVTFPEDITILNNSATQPLAEAVSQKTALMFFRGKGMPSRPIHLMYPELIVDKKPSGQWNTPNRTIGGAGDLDFTLDYTSPKTSQSGWHPLMLDYDDVEDTENSGIGVNQDVRQHVIDVCDQNENTLRDGGYVNIGGTRYHPLDWYGKCLERAKRNPDDWEVLVRTSLTVKSGARLVPGEFPAEDDVELHFSEFANLSYRELRDKFIQNYESFMCFRAGCKVLMADWTEKPIEQVKVDDEVIGFERIARYHVRLVKSKVQKVFSRKAEVAKVTTECGRVTYPTFDHRFLRPPNGTTLRYVKLKPGSPMVSVYTPAAAPTQELQRDLDWLGGMLDGEGSISEVGVHLSQKEEVNREVYAAIGEVLKRLEIDCALGKTHETGRFSLAGGRSLLIRLIQQARMMKVERIHNVLWGAKQISETSGRRGGSSYPIVESMQSAGEQIVYDIQTSTSNFVCDGFAVHNCQQQNDPQGGHVQRFSEAIFNGCQIAPERIPNFGGDTFMVWRPRYGGKPSMAKYSEGAVAKILDGKVFVLDAWQGTYTPSGEAEKIVHQAKTHQVDGLMLCYAPGSEYVMSHVRNEALRRNYSLKMQWLEFVEDDNQRIGAIEQLEPLMKVGRVLFSTSMTKAAECRKQFVHFGIIEENGIADCISKFADMVPISQMRANMSEEELEYQRRRRDDAMLSAFLEQQGMPTVDEQLRAKVDAHTRAIGETSTFRLPALPGGLDG